MDGIKKKKRAQGHPERISFGMGRKVNLGNYESVDTHISYSRDIAPGETFESALKAVAKRVDKALAKREKIMRKAAQK